MTRRKVAVVTGSRAEFGLLQPVMEAIRERRELELQVLFTGMHMLPEFGDTKLQVLREYPDAIGVPVQVRPGKPLDTAEYLGQGILELGQVFSQKNPTFVVVLGDRTESLAAGLAAVHTRRVLAHVHGGDVSMGRIDDSARHVLTLLAHVHFPATATSADRIRRLGQAAWRIHVAGAPGLDALREAEIAEPPEARRHVGLDGDRPYLVVLHHPDTLSPKRSETEIERVLEAVAKMDFQVVAIYPNSDLGHMGIVKHLLTAHTGHRIKLVRSLERRIFLGLLRGAIALVGNSSCGIIECPALGVPFVEVGTRQAGRERGSNVLTAKVDAADIARQIERAREPGFRESLAGAPHPYGDGHAGERIAEVLAGIEINERLLQKELDFP